MLYFSKFVALWLLPPGLFVLLLFFAALFLFRQGKAGSYTYGFGKCCFVGAVLLYMLSTDVVGSMLLRPLEYAYTPRKTAVDAIVVLGGGATPNTPDISGNGNVGPFAANRLLTAVQLQRQTGVPILVTGGKVFANSGNEAEISQRILLNLGLDKSKIVLEKQARNTTENAKFSALLASEKQYKRVYIVTSAFHMPRSMLNFERFYKIQGIELVPYPCDFMTSPNYVTSVFSWLPQFNGLEMSCIALHEYLGILALKLP